VLEPVTQAHGSASFVVLGRESPFGSGIVK
jgi:hypothetical protein